MQMKKTKYPEWVLNNRKDEHVLRIGDTGIRGIITRNEEGKFVGRVRIGNMDYVRFLPSSNLISVKSDIEEWLINLSDEIRLGAGKFNVTYDEMS